MIYLKIILLIIVYKRKMQLTLKQSDQHRLTTILTNFSKTETNILKFSELTMLLLDRCTFSHRFTFKDYLRIFKQAEKVRNKKDQGKDSIQGEKILSRDQIIIFFNEIAKLMYLDQNNCQAKFYSDFLGEKVDTNDGQFHPARCPVFDDLNRRFLNEEAIQILAQYENQLKNVYVMYMIENYFSLKKSKRILLSERQIKLQNKKWPYTSLILFLKESETTPHLSTVDVLEEAMRTIVPHIGQKQQQFYSKHVIIDTYQKDAELHEGTHHVGDPGLYFHQFLLLLARISWECYPKQMEKKSVHDVILRYFNYIFVRKNEDLAKGIPLPNLNRKMIAKMKDYYKCLETEHEDYDQQKKQNKNEESGIQILTKRIKNQIINSTDLGLDFNETLKTLDKELPRLPPVPVIVPEAPGPYDKANAITIGQQPPPEPVDKQKGAKQEKKSGGNNKEEIPARVFLWQDMPVAKTSIEDHLKSVHSKLTYEVQPLNDIARGTIRKQSYPVIIGETLFPGELPKTVVPFLKQATKALNDRNFVLALQSYENGLKAWKKTQVEIDSASELFFQYSKGNVFLSIGKLEYALQCFYGCRKFSDTSKLPFNNPDRSLPYFGLGEVFYEMQQYSLAARSFLKAREIREGVLGIENVQTATVFNNLACSYFMLGRSHQALGYIQIAEVVFDTELGEHHERTMTCRSNLKKIGGGTFDNQPEFRKFWEVFEEDKFEKKKKKKDKEGKKK